MTIPFRARLVDVANLVIAKGANFILTVIVFALLSRGMDSLAFGEFGYWWSIAIMIGGVFLGGISSALVRAAASHGSLRHLVRAVRVALLGLTSMAVVVAAAALAVPQWHTAALLLLAVSLFGVAVQAQAALLSLIRAIEATKANVWASALIVVLVPLTLFLMLGSARTLPTIFMMLSLAFSIGTLAAAAAARARIAHLFEAAPTGSAGVATFAANASSFTAISIFSYAAVNIDFTLFRLIGGTEDFALMATGKVFFERFLVPVLMVFGGAISLRILRHGPGVGIATPRLEVQLTPKWLAAALTVVVVLALAYRTFAHSIRGDVQVIAWPWVILAASGYLLYVVNGVLFDVLVVRRRLTNVVVHVTAFLLLCAAIQMTAIRWFGVPGWAVGWLLFNIVVFVVLARDGLHLRLIGWRWRRSSS